MLDKPLTEITYGDIERFVAEQWPEGKIVDYKLDVYGRGDKEKKELLKDVSSFANTDGGYILIGVDEKEALPTDIPGVVIDDVDDEKLRMQEIIQRGIEPRIDFEIHSVQSPSNTKVIVIRVNESLLLPHRVVYHGTFGEFWARNSSGKYSMDTMELRQAFTLSETVYNQIRSFRENRIEFIQGGRTPVPLTSTGKIVLHLIPVASFRSRLMFPTAEMRERLDQSLPLITTRGYTLSRLNFDGFLKYAVVQGSENSRGAYSLFFHNGAIEATLSGITEVIEDNTLDPRYEHEITYQFPHFLRLLKEIGINPPIWGALTVIGVNGAYMNAPHSEPTPRNILFIDRDTLLLPEFKIESFEFDANEILAPVFDLVWNASGHPRSPNFGR